MIPKSILFGGLGLVGLGVLGFWVLDGGGEDEGTGEFDPKDKRARGENLANGSIERHVSGKSKGTGVGRRKMDRNQIVEIGKRLRWELNPLRRRAALGQLLEGMDEGNAMLVREQIVHFSEETPEFQDFHFAWGAMSGVEAVEMGSETEEKDMAATMTGWASVDPVAALSWYEALEEDRRKCRDVTFGMLKGLTSSDLVFATDFVVGKLEAGNKYAAEMMGLVKERMLEAETMPTAAEWAVDLPEGKVRDEMLAGVTGEFVKREPLEAAKWAETLQGEEGRRIKQLVAEKWAQKDPVGSLEWARDLPDEQGKSASMAAVVSEWAKQDPGAVNDFLNEMPQTREKDSAVEAFSARIAGEDPHSAIAWANEIQDEAARRNSLIRAGRALMQQSVEEGREWLEESGLSENMRKKIEK